MVNKIRCKVWALYPYNNSQVFGIQAGIENDSWISEFLYDNTQSHAIKNSGLIKKQKLPSLVKLRLQLQKLFTISK